MADYVLDAFSKGAENNLQVGIDKYIYVFNQSEVDTITFDAVTREIDTITMQTGKQAYKFQINADEALVEFEGGGGATGFGVQRLTFRVDGLTASVRKALEPYMKSTGVGVLIPMANGQRWITGISLNSTDSTDDFCYVGKINGAATLTSGTNSDSTGIPVNGRPVIWNWNANNEPLFVENSLDLAVLAAPAV